MLFNCNKRGLKMDFTLSNIIVLIIVLLAVGLVARRVIRTMGGRESSCGCGSGAGCCPASPLKMGSLPDSDRNRADTAKGRGPEGN